MTERLTVEMVDELAAREDHEDGSDRYYHLLGTVTSPVLIRAALVERDEARAALVELQAERDAATRRADAAELGLDHALTAGEQGLVAELDAARADVATLTQALETAQARIDELTARAVLGVATREVAEPSTAEEYETLTEAPETYEALLNGVDAIDARRKS